ENSSAPVQCVNSCAHPQSAARPSAYALYKYPTFAAGTLFVLMLSGPPRLRFRDLQASLRGETDWVVAFHVVVWALAGLWILVQIGVRFQAKRPLLRLRLPLIIALGLIISLTVSI